MLIILWAVLQGGKERQNISLAILSSCRCRMSPLSYASRNKINTDLKRHSWEFWHCLPSPLVGNKISVESPKSKLEGVAWRDRPLEGRGPAGWCSESWAASEDRGPLARLCGALQLAASGEALQRAPPSGRSYRCIFSLFPLPGERRALGSILPYNSLRGS